MVQAAQGNGEFVAHLAPEGELLGEAQVVRLGGLASTKCGRIGQRRTSHTPCPEGAALTRMRGRSCRWLSPSGRCMLGADDLLANCVNSFWCHVSPPFQVVFCDGGPPSGEQRWIR